MEQSAGVTRCLSVSPEEEGKWEKGNKRLWFVCLQPDLCLQRSPPGLGRRPAFSLFPVVQLLQQVQL